MLSIHLNRTSPNMLINAEISGKRSHTTLARSLSREVRKFVDEMIIPNESTLAQSDEAASRLQSELGQTADHREAVEAFLAKRAPEFTGR